MTRGGHRVDTALADHPQVWVAGGIPRSDHQMQRGYAMQTPRCAACE